MRGEKWNNYLLMLIAVWQMEKLYDKIINKERASGENIIWGSRAGRIYLFLFLGAGGGVGVGRNMGLVGRPSFQFYRSGINLMERQLVK